jgi:hypothetical protein
LYVIFSDLKSSLNRNLQEESERKGHFGLTESTLDLELSSDAKSVEDDDSAIGEGISESHPTLSARAPPKPAESTPASMHLEGTRQNFFPESEKTVRNVVIPGSGVGSLFVAPPASKMSENPMRDEEFKAVSLQLSEVHDSDDSDRHSQSQITQKRNEVDRARIEQKKQQETEELERRRQNEVETLIITNL